MRIPRQGKATGKHNIKYCFVEFSDESTCDSAKDKLAANPDFVVDYVGEKSKNRQANASAGKQFLHHSTMAEMTSKKRQFLALGASSQSLKINNLSNYKTG